MKKFILFYLLFIVQIIPQQIPLEKNNYQKLTSYKELTKFIYRLDRLSASLKIEVIGQSVEGRNIYALKFSNSKFGKDTSKIKVLIFAQQHGDEQSGKEGVLLLAAELTKPGFSRLLKRMDIALIPQMNPDGSERNVRVNADEMDLNRNHLILTEPETIALHKFFDKYLFEATMDVHEYYPYPDDWIKFGYIKNFDEQVGAATNPNVSEKIRKLSNEKYFPFIESYLKERKYSFHNYMLGGPPDINLIRYSTYDINDGRQSLGILNSFSFIQEGKNGRDSIENIRRRTEGQAAGIAGFLNYIYSNKNKIKSLVHEESSKLISGKVSDSVAIQMDHFNTEQKLKVPLLSLYSGTDSVITVNDYRPVVKSIYNVKRPSGYLIPKSKPELYEWAQRQNLHISAFHKTRDIRIQRYFVSRIDSIDFEGDIIVNPVVKSGEVSKEIKDDEFYYIPTDQLKNNLIVTALEPKSMLGLVTYKQYSHLLKAGEYFPVLRVVDNNK
jgi:hypothetical protein